LAFVGINSFWSTLSTLELSKRLSWRSLLMKI
jgi:hypothetical protein